MPTERVGYVAMFDVLGTRGAWRSRPLSEVVAERDRFDTTAQSWAHDQQFYKEHVPALTGKPAPSYELRLDSFSDSFIVTYWSEEPERQQVNHLANQLTGMFDFALSERMLFRGAISHGEFCQGVHSLVGPAVDEAYEWADLGEWAGIVCTPSARKMVDAVGNQSQQTLKGEFAGWPVPLSDGHTYGTWALWWPRTGSRKPLLEAFLDPPVLPTVERKLTNTLAFYDWATREFPVGVAGEP